ncbi:hypothetical protein FHETE_2362 [Fusarium heterosporum]|uniref:Methyltransferase domain-containing protein n=1 Tax=Fusarium heterosporum TaxID=42747 RepID=A0A8H5TP14_FUSHE|nr:hypothetical protein FHETE_2362 [Fusarium heterosporum]
MNAPESDLKFSPKQALVPTPALYGEIVGDGMEQLAAVSLSCIDSLGPDAVVHDVGCGLGAATSAVVANFKGEGVLIKGSDINKDVVDAYRQNIAKNKWPAEAFEMDASALDFPEETFTLSIASGVIFVLPNDGIDAVKEMYRTLKPGGIAIVNSWAYTPTIPAIHAACKKTRPLGTPLPRQGLEKWEDNDFLRAVVIKGGFTPENVSLEKRNVFVTVGDLKRFATMIWSFIAGTTTAGWLESDEESWDAAVDEVVEGLMLTEGYEKLADGKNKIMFKANIAVARK